MRWIVILIVALLPSAGQAGTYQDKDGSWWTEIDPPASYQTAPYLKPPAVQFLPRSEVFVLCLAKTNQSGRIGCGWFASGRCELRIAEDLPEKARKITLAHEDSHCRGWPADHPLD